MPKYTERVDGLISANDKEKLKAIKKENNDITIRYIIEEFIADYCSTKPKGIKLEIKEIEKEIKDIEDQIYKLHEDKIKLEIELKTKKDKLNTTLDSYIDEDLTKAIESINKICDDRNFTVFEDIPEITFIQIAKNNKTSLETLKKEVKKIF